MLAPNLWLCVDITAGTRIDDACRALIDLAARTGVGVKATFNGTRIYARPTDDAIELEARYEAEQRYL